MTTARFLLSAMVPVALLIGTRPGADTVSARPARQRGIRKVDRQSCTIETRPLSFGIYDPGADGNDVDAIGQIIYTCENQAKKIRIDMRRKHEHVRPREAKSTGPTSHTTSISTRLTGGMGQRRARTHVYYREQSAE